MPKRIANEARQQKMLELLKGLDGLTYETVSKQTVNYALIDLSHLFTWAGKQDLYTGKNPCDGVAFEGVESTRFELFTDPDLRAIFSSPEFNQERTGDHPYHYWLVWILALTGTRRGEIAKLRAEDIRQEEGVWFFDIVDEGEEGKRLKNKHSRRRVPIHSKLLELGFLETRPKEGMLFPKAYTGKGRKTVGDAFTKWFNRLRRSLDITGKKPPHSFRHTAITKLASASVPADVQRILTGHAAKDVHGETYTHLDAVSLVLLRGNLEKLTMPV
ncbi:MAG: site-specific integrase [Nitrospira sp.]|nr:MAG: site-specific integrase [Nitrospira sp.]